MNRILILLLALAPAGVAHAQDVTRKPLGEAFLRYESVEQGGLHGAKLGKVTESVRYAHYRAGNFATDTGKYWLQLDWTL